MQLYHQLQAKLTQQEVDYQNMHTHSTIVRGDHGKVTKIDSAQYHPDMQLKQFEHGGAQNAHYAAGDFKPAKPERPPSQATPAAFVAQGTMGTGRPSRSSPMRDGQSLITLLALPAPTERDGDLPQVNFEQERKEAKANVKRNAPNQNKYVSNIAERVKQRRAKTLRSTYDASQETREDIREKSAREKQSARQAKFERRRNTKNPRKRKENPMTKTRRSMEY